MSTQPTQMVQCRLVRQDGIKTRIMTVWIDERGAKVDAEVELLPSGEFWKVEAVFNRMDASVLKETQRQRRTPPPSIRDTIKDKRQAAR